MVAYRLTRNVGQYTKGDMLLVDREQVPEEGEVAVIKEGWRTRCVVYSGQPGVIGVVLGAVVKRRGGPA